MRTSASLQAGKRSAATFRPRISAGRRLESAALTTCSEACIIRGSDWEEKGKASSLQPDSESGFTNRNQALSHDIKSEGFVQEQTRHSKLLVAGLWTVGLTTIGFMAADFIVRPTVTWLSLMPVYSLAVFALLHSFTHMNTRQALWFLALGLILAFVAEYFGTNFGAVFGSHYFARSRDLAVTIGVRLPGRVSLAVVLSWYSMLYLTFVVATHLLHARRTDASAFAAVPLTAGLLMAFWQITAGPMAIARGTVRYLQDGFYHGLPLSSFIGWFVTAVFIVLFFQTVEPDAVDAPRLNRNAGVARLAYLMFGMTLLYPALMCFRFHMTGAAWLGTAIILIGALAFAVRDRAPHPVARLSAATGVPA